MSKHSEENGPQSSGFEENLSDEQRSALESRRRFVRNTLAAGGLLAATGALTDAWVRPAAAQQTSTTTGAPTTPAPTTTAQAAAIPALGGAGLAALGAALGGGVLIGEKKRRGKASKDDEKSE